MRLTQAISPSSSSDGFPTLQLFVLAICRVAEPIALTSIYPYSFPMVKSFHVGDPKDASFYSGILISAFALSESLTGMWWGGVSDRIGRKPILLLGCFGTIISLLMVGFSRSFTMALIGRVLGGLLNGNIGVIQTMVGELVKRPEHEAKAFSVMPFVWSIGTIIGPALGGLFANPAETFPSVFAKDGVFDVFPYLLPNLICAVFMCGSIAAGFVFLKETRPTLSRDEVANTEASKAIHAPQVQGASVSIDPAIDLCQGSYGTFNEVEIRKTEEWDVCSSNTDSISPSRGKWFTWKIFMLVTALGIYSYHSMCYDALFPIFFEEKRANDITTSSIHAFLNIDGGLGMTIQTVGLIMSVSGVIALFVQAVVFQFVADRLGIWRTFAATAILHPIAYFIMPFLVLLPSKWLYPGIYTCLTIRHLFSILEYPVILILIKNASPSTSVLGRINGLAASVGAAARTIAPPIAGILWSKGIDIGFSGLAWWAAGAVALAGGIQLYFIPRDGVDTLAVEASVSCVPATITVGNPQSDVVKITVIDAVHEV